MVQPQPPIPPPPDVFPAPPPVIFQDGPPEIVLIAVVSLVGIIAAGVLLLPLVRALARRLEGKTVDNAYQAELEQLRARVAELEPLQHRIAELEERVDFSERLLTQGRDAARAPGGTDGSR
ncbi:MAG: hypothetical protein FJ206_14930 [Gemmatimonadetes bacterium]|nr:hypothetical protein [Gemmatimonadota bacterium]